MAEFERSDDSSKVERVYRTGDGGYRQAAFLALAYALFGTLVGLTLLVPLRHRIFPMLAEIGLWFVAFVNPFTLPLVVVAVAAMLRQRNMVVAVTDVGLEVQDWRKGRRLVAWEDIVALVWRRYTLWWPDRYALAIRVRESTTESRELAIGYCYNRESEDLADLRSEVVSRRQMSAVSAEDADRADWIRRAGASEVRAWRVAARSA